MKKVAHDSEPCYQQGKWGSKRRYYSLAAGADDSSGSEGADLYIIPGIDMVNHSTDPSLINTSLHRRQQAAEMAEGASENGGPSADFFTLEAGKSLHKTGDHDLTSQPGPCTIYRRSHALLRRIAESLTAVCCC